MSHDNNKSSLRISWSIKIYVWGTSVEKAQNSPFFFILCSYSMPQPYLRKQIKKNAFKFKNVFFNFNHIKVFKSNVC
jgi:hypothetical protein